ncbi:hypothetical protein FRC15_002447 [Serendipita sp. 397]|nr:hypothetical protein FRC15_002447 [Serendipita sp. 397]
MYWIDRYPPPTLALSRSYSMFVFVESIRFMIYSSPPASISLADPCSIIFLSFPLGINTIDSTLGTRLYFRRGSLSHTRYHDFQVEGPTSISTSSTLILSIRPRIIRRTFYGLRPILIHLFPDHPLRASHNDSSHLSHLTFWTFHPSPFCIASHSSGTPPRPRKTKAQPDIHHICISLCTRTHAHAHTHTYSQPSYLFHSHPMHSPVLLEPKTPKCTIASAWPIPADSRLDSLPPSPPSMDFGRNGGRLSVVLESVGLPMRFSSLCLRLLDSLAFISCLSRSIIYIPQVLVILHPPPRRFLCAVSLLIFSGSCLSR